MRRTTELHGFTQMKTFRLKTKAAVAALAFAALASSSLNAAEIPDRPEKLQFKPLVYNPPNPAEFRVALKSGPIAYILPDKELPLVNLVVKVRVGKYLEPKGKEGLASFVGYLLSKGGTKSWSAEEFEEHTAFLAADVNSGIGDTQGDVSVNLLSKDLDEGLKILREVLTSPRFQDDKIDLRRQQLLQRMKQRNDNSRDIESRERSFLTRGENFWSNRHSTKASLESIAKSDLQAFHKAWFHPGNFVVAANGDFDRDALISKLEALFTDWPSRGATPPAIPTNTEFAKSGAYLVDKEVNQGRVSIVLPGIQRDNPDFNAVRIMNDILGGGGFTSRIMNRVRSDEGLAYSASSHFPGGVYYPSIFMAGFQSKSRTVAYASSIVIEEMERIRNEDVTDEEIQVSKASFIDTFPRNFGTKSQVADTFSEDEFTGRYAKDKNYWKEYRDRVQAVTKAEIKRVAKKYLDPNKIVILVVGAKDDLLKGHPDHPERLESLAGGKVTELPLRDPFTMRPMKE